MNCHMVGRYYMGNDYRRDHSFRIPRPDLTLSIGAPNACNDCHKAKLHHGLSPILKNGTAPRNGSTTAKPLQLPETEMKRQYRSSSCMPGMNYFR